MGKETHRFFLRDAELHHPFQRVKASARNMQLLEPMGNFRLTKWMRLEWSSAPSTWISPYPTSSFQSRMLRTISSQALSISTNGDSTDSLGNLCQSLTTHPREKCVFRWNSMWFNLCLVPPTLSASGFLFLTSLCLPSQQVFIHMKIQNNHQQLYPPNSASSNSFLI